MMQAVTELDFVLSNVFVTLTTVTVAASAAPGGTMVEDDRLRILARRFRKNEGMFCWAEARSRCIPIRTYSQYYTITRSIPDELPRTWTLELENPS